MHVIKLPKNATPIDFAYAVHTDIGNSCVGGRINRRLAALSQPLQSGQTIEIITAPGANPNPCPALTVALAPPTLTARC